MIANIVLTTFCLINGKLVQPFLFSMNSNPNDKSLLETDWVSGDLKKADLLRD